MAVFLTIKIIILYFIPNEIYTITVKGANFSGGYPSSVLQDLLHGLPTITADEQGCKPSTT